MRENPYKSESPITIEFPVQFVRKSKGQKDSHGKPDTSPIISEGRVPRISRLMALALRFERLVASGEVKDYAELARLGHITRARATQVMNLLCLAPNIQEELLFLPPVQSGRDPIKELMLRPIAATPDWRKQRKMWKECVAE